MTPATASSPLRPSAAIPAAGGDRSADRVIEIDVGEGGDRREPALPLTTARLEELARAIRLR